VANVKVLAIVLVIGFVLGILASCLGPRIGI